MRHSMDCMYNEEWQQKQIENERLLQIVKQQQAQLEHSLWITGFEFNAY